MSTTAGFCHLEDGIDEAFVRIGAAVVRVSTPMRARVGSLLKQDGHGGVF